MKKLLFILIIFYGHAAFAQSPGLIIHLRIDSVKTGGLGFKIEMKFCDPVIKTKAGTYFTNDSSTIDFRKLTEKDIGCTPYKQNSNKSSYHYYFSNQVFAWEKIIIWKISAASRDWKEPMYVILPVKIKSFVTFIEIKDVEFEAGKFIWIDEKGKIEADKHQHFIFSLKDIKGIQTANCSLKTILD